MTRTRPVQTAFSSGEIDPLLAERNDFQRFQTGLERCRGFIPLRQGGITRAPGTIFRGTTAENKKAVRIPFTFARNDSQALELTDGKMRVWRYGQLVTTGAGDTYELATPFTEDDLVGLDWVQNGDELFVADGKRPVHRISRRALDDWEIAPVEFTNGPFQPRNVDENKTLGCSASVGEITLSSNWDYFTALHSGILLSIEPTDFNNVPFWVGNQSASIGDFVRYDGNIYQLAAGADSGLQPPVHSVGTVLSSKGSDTKWTFVSTETGIVRITDVLGPREARAVVLKTIPKPAVDDTTYRWSEGAWNKISGYPRRIALYRKRLYLANSDAFPRMLWASTLGNLKDFEPSSLADGSFAYEIAGEGARNEITWISGGGQRGLYIGALGEVHRGFSAVAGRSIGPDTFDTETVDTSGSAFAKPVMPYGFPVYISADKARVLETRYSFENDGSKPVELSLPSQHLAEAPFEQIVWQSAPHHYGWLRRGDGTLICMVYYPDQDVLGWAPVPIANGFVEWLDVTVSADGAYDLLTVIVRRNVNGETVRYVEEQAINIRPLLNNAPPLDFNHAFAGLKLSVSEPQSQFSLPHLAGVAEVWAWTDQGQVGPYPVSSEGLVDIETAVTQLVIGLADSTHKARTLAIPAAAKDGDSRGRKRRLHNPAGISVFKTAAGGVRAVERHFLEPDVVGDVEQIVERTVAADIAPTVTGLLSLNVPSGYADSVHLEYLPVGIAPMTLRAQIATVEEAGP